MKRIANYITAVCDEWLRSTKAILKDEGALIFFVLLPLAYPLLYSWVYNNEVVRKVPVALVDESGTKQSRDFVNRYNASPDAEITLRVSNMDEARQAVGRGDVYGIILIPRDFATNTGRMEQTHIGIYCDMSYMLAYKAVYATAMAVATDMGKDIQTQMMTGMTDREQEVMTKPLDYEEVALFNTTGGYGNFILPGVLVLIIQQAMLLGVGMMAGTDRERAFRRYMPHEGDTFLGRSTKILMGQTMAVGLIFAVMLAWITLVVPRLFGFVSMVHAYDLTLFLLPYLLACIFFSITVSSLVRYRESVLLIVVVTSVPLLFLSGLSWPQNNIPGAWQGVASLFPSSYAIRGFMRMNSMGALLPDVAAETVAMWIQTAVYAVTALFVIWQRVRLSVVQEENKALRG